MKAVQQTSSQASKARVLYSFPHSLGAARICTTAWHQVEGIAAAGVDVTVVAASVRRPVPAGVKLRKTLSWGKLRLPYRLVGTRRACAIHDWLVARSLKSQVGKVDVVHLWPLAALRTLREAKRLGIPTVLERPNAHTRYAYEVVREECKKLGVTMPEGHEHDYNEELLRIEELEYDLADRLLCPSDFVAQTFLDRGFAQERLARNQYGFDEKVFFPKPDSRKSGEGLSMLFAGGCAPRKGLHYALDAWLRSDAHHKGTFQIAGGFIPGYAERLSAQLSHPSVKVLGHRRDVPDLMRQSDILVLSSIEEGSALVTSEARGCGCVLLVSDASGAVCAHGVNALVHGVGDVDTLTQHLNTLHHDRNLLARLREASLKTVGEITWIAAGTKLRKIYEGLLK